MRSKHYKNLQELHHERFLVDVTSFAVTHDVVHLQSKGSKVVEFFEGKSIFITGGTGFLGKLIIEKLLRSCKGIKKIYFLIRTKRNKDVSTRTEELFQNIVFSELGKVQPDFQEKLIPVNGDISVPNLGLNETDLKILKNEVNVIFHVAANVKLDEKLVISTRINVEGTLNLLTLAKACRNIVSLVYVSTAYSNSIRDDIEERLYTPTMEAEELLKLIKKMGKNFDNNEKSILGEWSNAYTMTKNIAEYAMKTHGGNLPLSIVRPAIVINTFNEPLKRYIDNYYGSIGVISNNFTGIMRTIHADREKRLECVPADFVANIIIVAAYKNHIIGRGNMMIYNFISSVENPIKLGDFHDLAAFYGHQTPTMKSFWYPCNTLNKNYKIHLMYTLFLHFIPAFFIDLYLQLLGKKPWMISLYRKIFKFSESIAWYARKEWHFSNNNTQELWRDLSDIDKKIFPFSMSREYFNWNEYLEQINLGIRLYLLNDKMHTLKEARRKHAKLYYLHMGVKIVITSILLFLVAKSLKNICEIHH